MPETVQQLIEHLGPHKAKHIIEAQITYPRTDGDNVCSEKAMVEFAFDGTLYHVIQTMEYSPELNTVDAVKDSVSVMKLMEVSKKAILLDQADYVLIYKGGFDVIKLTNNKMPASGRSIYIELNAVKHELIRRIEAARERHFRWLEVVTSIGLGVILMFNVVLAIRRGL
jgi:hypothetical protein